MKITYHDFKKIVGRVKDSEAWYETIVALSDKYEINTEERWAGFLAQVHHESAGFKYMKENLYYSAKGLNAVFPKYFVRAGRDARKYAKKPQAIANVVYADRMGNGDIKSGDGYRYRGRGIIQLTGKNNYVAFAKHINKTLEEAIKYLDTKQGATHSAMYFWQANKLNKFCDKKDIVGMTKRINGGTNGLKERKKIWNKALDYFSNNDKAQEEKHVVAQVTNNQTVITLADPLGMGDRGDMVKQVQSALGITADGIFGNMTKSAVKKFQRNNGLIPDGIVGPRTFNLIISS